MKKKEFAHVIGSLFTAQWLVFRGGEARVQGGYVSLICGRLPMRIQDLLLTEAQAPEAMVVAHAREQLRG